MDIFDLIEFEDPDKNSSVIKASIHKSGKLGFSSGAQEFLAINENSYFKVGFDSEDNSVLYLVPANTGDKAFKVSKAGVYYYMNLKHVFDKKGIEYQNNTIIFDIKKEVSNQIVYYVLNKRKK